MKLQETLSVIIDHKKHVFRTLLPEDVSKAYINALKTERKLIEYASIRTNIGSQKRYVERILESTSDAICGLFLNSELIGTSGMQNLSEDETMNRLKTGKRLQLRIRMRMSP